MGFDETLYTVFQLYEFCNISFVSVQSKDRFIREST
jgi:hypothetical protein